MKKKKPIPPKLHTEINRLLHPQTAWENLRDFCDQNVEKLGDSLRINDAKNEGVLYVRGRKLIRRDGDLLPSTSVAPETLQNEEGLSYAIFNGRHQPLGSYQLVSWEAQLLRPVRRVAGFLKVKCDLVAYDAIAKQLVAVEVKLNPESDDTSLQHGLLQSMAYGHLLRHSWETNRSGLERQLQTCLRAWCGKEQDELPEIESVVCALAAPKQYFKESSELYGGQSRWFSRAINIKDAHFSKFWVLECGDITGVEVADRRGNPQLIPQTACKAKFFTNVNTLAEYCR